MAEKIKFSISVDKATEVIVWIADRKPWIDIYHVAKVLFLAEKEHINKYAQPIIGDKFCKFDNGPAPSTVLDLINNNEFLSPKHRERIQSAITVDLNYPKKIKALRGPDMSYFSGTDVECLASSLDKYGNLSFDELYKLTHSMKSYIETDLKDTIDYALLIDDDNPYHDEILNHLRETAPCLHM